MTRAWAEPPPRRPAPRAALVAAALAACALLAGTLARWYSPASPAVAVVLTSHDSTNPELWTPIAAPRELSRAALGRLAADLGSDPAALAAVVVSGPGFARADGPAVAVAGAESPADAVPVAYILDVLARLPAKRAKLLVLDCTTPRDFADWGVAHNGFAAALGGLRGRIAAVPNLTVLSASGPGERSYWDAERGGSAFLVQLSRGWSGAADGNGDGRVTTAELAGWVADATTDWARRNRQGVQRPVVYPSSRGRDAVVSMGRTPPPELDPAAFAPGDDWRAAWADYARLVADPATMLYAPVPWVRYSREILHWPRRALAGESSPTSLKGERETIIAAKSMAIAPRSQSLPLSANLAGLAPLAERSADVAALAGLPPDQRRAAWLRSGGGDPVAAALAACRALVAWAAADPPGRLAAARGLLPVVGDGLDPLPAEAAFLAGVADRLGPVAADSPLGPRVAEVLKTRLVAEVAAVPRYAEVVGPWVAAPVAAADARRRVAEDRLFVSGDADPAGGAHYADAEAARAAVESALVARLRAADFLAGCQPWLAEPWGGGLVDRAAAESRLSEAERLWAICHRVADRLAVVPAETERDATLRQLAADGGELGRGVASLKSEFESEVRARLGRRPDALDRAALLAWWRQSECLIESAPPGELVAGHCELAVEWYRVSRQLLVIGGESVGELDGPTKELDRARRLGRLLVARVTPADADLSAARFRYEHAARQPDPARELAEADALASAAYCRAAPADPVAADRWARLTPAGRGDETAVVALRRLRVGDALLRQAGRALADDWSLAGRPASRLAALALAREARRFGADESETRPLIAAASEEPTVPVLASVAPPELFTDEPDPAANVAAVSQIDGGVPAVRAGSGPWTPPGERRVPLPPPTPGGAGVRRVELPVQAFFRGRTRDFPLFVRRASAPDLTLAVAAPATGARLALRADADLVEEFGRGVGRLAIVIDATGSMAADPNDAANPGRFPKAVEAAEVVLNRLPRGVSVRVSAFGQFGATGLAELRPLAPWEGPAETPNVVALLRGLRPWSESPVVRAVAEAKAGLAAPPGGFAAVLLIGDAVDTAFAADAKANPKKLPISEGLRAAFDGSGVALHVVALPVGDAAEAAAQAEFKAVTQFRPAGSFGQSAAAVAELLARQSRPELSAELIPVDRTETPTPVAVGAGVPTLTGVAAGRYAIRTAVAESRLEVRNGETLPLRLTRAGGVAAWRLDDGGQFALDRATPRAGVAVASFARLRGDAEIRMFAPTEGVLRLARAGACWAEPASGAGPLRLTLSPGLAVAGIPERVRLWLLPEGANATSGAAGVTLRPPTVESHEVEVRPGVREPRRCRVVRVEHPPGNAAWVEVESGPRPEGSEVRAYAEAARTTTLLWWPEGALPDGVGWAVRSRAGVTGPAEARGYPVELRVAPRGKGN